MNEHCACDDFEQCGCGELPLHCQWCCKLLTDDQIATELLRWIQWQAQKAKEKSDA